ncbi:MAG: dihydrofolate reductase [Chloroflexi bacterium]|nr:dihydrofolate reductase [Chloroflexota bacterium]
MKISAYIATSLDGFIARENGDLNWLPGSDGNEAGSGEDYGYRQFMESVDILVMGRHTYEMVISFGEWPYGEKQVIVLSSKGIEIPENLAEKVESSSSSPTDLVDRLRKSGAKHLYIDGGKTIQSFLQDALIDEIIITRIPILIGSGIPLFGELDRDRKVQHIETRSYDNGFVQSKYKVLG